jgi:hypothetical protein
MAPPRRSAAGAEVEDLSGWFEPFGVEGVFEPPHAAASMATITKGARGVSRASCFGVRAKNFSAAKNVTTRRICPVKI